MRLRAAVTASVVCALGFVALGVAVRHGPTAFDTTLHDFALAHRAGVVRRVAEAVTFGGSAAVTAPLVLAAALTFARPGARGRWLASALAVGIGVQVGSGIRYVLAQAIHRQRPPDLDWIGSPRGFAYASGHTASSALAAGALAWALSRRTGARWQPLWWGLAAAYALAVGWSRIWLGVHWPTDVLGGWLFAVAWLSGMRSVERLLVLSRADEGRSR